MRRGTGTSKSTAQGGRDTPTEKAETVDPPLPCGDHLGMVPHSAKEAWRTAETIHRAVPRTFACINNLFLFTASSMHIKGSRDRRGGWSRQNCSRRNENKPGDAVPTRRQRTGGENCPKTELASLCLSENISKRLCGGPPPSVTPLHAPKGRGHRTSPTSALGWTPGGQLQGGVGV